MKKIVLVFVVLLAITMMSCEAHIHTIGKGAQGNNMMEQRQWYVLFGLVPLNTVDTSQMAAGATDYTIETESSALDIVMNIFTSYVTVTSRTVTVTK